MRIGYLSTDWSFDFLDVEGFPTPGGAGWYRCHLPAQYLARNGIETIVAPVPVVKASGEICLVSWDDQRYDGFDVIVIQRWMSDKAEETIQRAKAAGQTIINDIDDWYGGLSPQNGAFNGSHPRRTLEMNRKVARRLKLSYTDPFNVNNYTKAIAASSGVTVSTPFLARKYQGVGKRAVLVRNAIDLERWTPRKVSDTPRPTLGWMGSTSHRSGDLETLRGVLEPFCEEHDLRVVHAGYVEGGTPFEELAGVSSERMIRVPSCPVRLVPRLFEQIDIGIVPLRDVTFNEAKSAINGMSCAASGVPYIASATPEYIWANAKHGLGTVVDKPRYWKRQLERLLDPEVRRVQAERGLQGIKSLDMAEQWSCWLEAYKSIHN